MKRKISLLLIAALLVIPVFAEEKTDVPEMIFVQGGTFQMGDILGDGWADERPVHEVTINDFYIDKYEVTQKEYQKVMGENPSSFKNCDDCPVERVTWFDAQEYCDKVGKRLPTEAEWEYAARSGGKKEKWAGTNVIPDAYVWYAENSGDKTHPVGQKKPNSLGIYDMSGNVWEWCLDWYDKDYYSDSPKDNPQHNSGGYSSTIGYGGERVLRGGAWYNIVSLTRTSYRTWFNPDDWFNSRFGFRCARTKQ